MAIARGARPAGRRRRPAVLAWALPMLALAAAIRFDQLLRQEGRPELVQLDAGGVISMLAAVSAATAPAS